MTENILYYGDNLDILRRYIKNETIDLIYLDPPFKSDQDYNILFAERNGSKAAAQIKAFDDTWHWDKASAADNTGFDFILHQTSRGDCHAPTTGARNHRDLRENLVTHTEILCRIRLRKNPCVL